jgi:predicted dehydrogenase
LSDGVDQWLVVGGRRWARIVATELCALLPPARSIRLQASRSEAGLLEWWNGSPHKRRIEIVDEASPCGASTTGVALIVNSAHEHRGSVETVLDAGYHVVCEKPLAFSRHDAVGLLARADGLGLKLFGTNTYLFAEYLHVLRRDWLRGRTFSELALTWADASGESRYGEAKRYDSSVPVFVDVLPHVASIVLATHGRWTFDQASIEVDHGGSAVSARFGGGELAVRASLSRNSPRRIRRLRFSGPEGQVALDFAVEPGVVSVDQENGVTADPAWDSRRKPIAQMLQSVQAYFDGGELDDRLGPDAALLAGDLIDGVTDSYVRQQIDFLDATSEASRGEEFAYAATEADALRRRGLPRLPQASPLRRLATLSTAGFSGQAEFNQTGRAFS